MESTDPERSWASTAAGPGTPSAEPTEHPDEPADGTDGGQLNPPGPVHPEHHSERAFMTYSGFAGDRQHVGFQLGRQTEAAGPKRGLPHLVTPPGEQAAAVAGTHQRVDAYPVTNGELPLSAGDEPASPRGDGMIVPIPALSADAGPSVVPQGRRVRAAVYNRFWHSMGGGERHNGMIAQVLAHDGAEVDILGHSPVDLAELGRHLGLDLSGCRYVRIPDRGEEDVSVLSGEYDLFVNGSYMSRLPTRSRRAAYLCFFPTPSDHDMAAWRRAAVRSAGPLLRGVRLSVDFGIGWYPPEGGRVRQWRWSSSRAVLSVSGGVGRVLRADFGRPGAPAATPLLVLGADGETIAKIDVGREFLTHEIPLPDSAVGTEITLVCEPFSPGPADVRELGVAISRARLVDGQESPLARVALRFPWLTRDPNDLAWVDRYDVVMANSDFTRGWIRRLWRQEADVLYPPIQVDRLRPAVTREKSIITVGRFFAPGLGHAKRQLEMVQWFGELHAAGTLPGWTLHVVGGMEDSQKPYVEEIKKVAAGLPVEIHPNAPRADVERLLSTASVFWSATGWGEDDRRRPWTAEHFGMTTVEAMAGGCVPVVIDRAGQREIVRHGIDGYRWTAPEQLLSFTRRLATEEELRIRLAAEAVQRAQQFSDAAFAERWRSIAARHHLYEA
jgi:glycosyltransferase involved in cell wall biosynthesis